MRGGKWANFLFKQGLMGFDWSGKRDFPREPVKPGCDTAIIGTDKKR
jgi:hypothetical protein